MSLHSASLNCADGFPANVRGGMTGSAPVTWTEFATHDDGPLIGGSRAGNGPPVLLLHGGQGSASTTSAISPTSSRRRMTSSGTSSEGRRRPPPKGRTRWRPTWTTPGVCSTRSVGTRPGSWVFVGPASRPTRRGGLAGSPVRGARRRTARIGRRRTLAGVRRGDPPSNAGGRARAGARARRSDDKGLRGRRTGARTDAPCLACLLR
jgi:hypothetical protein